MGIGLSPQQVARIRTEVETAFGQKVTSVWLFGSRARGEVRGDIDLCLELSDFSGNLLLARLALRRRLEADLGQKVDLVTHVAGDPIPGIVHIARDTGVEL
ncbi:MAG: nucleotidyltransferase domain-containing protein [Alphaproteobacteria bacterium]